MTPALTAEQQSQILIMAKQFSKQKERIRTMAKSGYVSEGRRAVLLKEQEARFCDFLKEL